MSLRNLFADTSTLKFTIMTARPPLSACLSHAHSLSSQQLLSSAVSRSFSGIPASLLNLIFSSTRSTFLESSSILFESMSRTHSLTDSQQSFTLSLAFTTEISLDSSLIFSHPQSFTHFLTDCLPAYLLTFPTPCTCSSFQPLLYLNFDACFRFLSLASSPGLSIASSGSLQSSFSTLSSHHSHRHLILILPSLLFVLTSSPVLLPIKSGSMSPSHLSTLSSHNSRCLNLGPSISYSRHSVSLILSWFPLSASHPYSHAPHLSLHITLATL